jgi:ribosomal protein S14
MKSLVIKDRNLRKSIRNNSKFLFLKKFVCQNSKLPSSKSNNRCIFTWRGKAVTRFFKQSRIRLRENSLEGYNTGVFKSSW